MIRLNVSAMLCGVFLACSPISTTDQEACEHLGESTSEKVTAAKTLNDAPVIQDNHKRHEVTLPSDKSKAFVRLNAEEAGDFIFFVDKTLSVELKNSSGETVNFEKVERSSAACATIKGKYTAELSPGTYFLQLGPDGTQWSEVVSVLVEHVEH